MLPIAIFHEHPDWFRPLFAELDRRASRTCDWMLLRTTTIPSERTVPYSLVFNRASPSAYLRGHRQSTFYTLQWLRYLDRVGVGVVNGASAYEMDITKALQIEAFESLGLPYPVTRLANSAEAVLEAARGLRYPVLVKANIGGSGAGIERFENRSALAERRAMVHADLGCRRHRAGAGDGAASRRAHYAGRGPGRPAISTRSTCSRRLTRSSISARPMCARQRMVARCRGRPARSTRRRPGLRVERADPPAVDHRRSRADRAESAWMSAASST